jgi:hypothetical protein
MRGIRNMSLHSKLFGNGKPEIIDRCPRCEYLKQSSLILDGEKLSATIKNISLSGLLIEFSNRDREFLKKALEKDKSCKIAVPYKGILVPEQIIIARIGTFCGNIICGCRFNEKDSDKEIVEKRERCVLSLMKG